MKYLFGVGCAEIPLNATFSQMCSEVRGIFRGLIMGPADHLVLCLYSCYQTCGSHGIYRIGMRKVAGRNPVNICAAPQSIHF